MRFLIWPLILLLYACAGKKMVAENADFLLETQIEKRLPLYSAQKMALSEDIDKFLIEQKPVIKRALPALNHLELNLNRVDDQYYFLKSVYDDISLKFTYLLCKHMAVLDKKQQKDFLQNLVTENEKIRRTKTYEIMKKVDNRFEKLFGKITPEQENLLAGYSDFFRSRNMERLARREELQRKIRLVYETSLSPDGKIRDFYEAFVDYHNKSINTEKNLEIIKKIVPTLDQKQREIFNGRVQELKEIIGYYLEANF